MPITLNGDTGITTPTYGGTDTSEYLVPVTAFKNRIINGAMQIDQRNNGASITPTNGQYSVDRWACYLSQTSKYSAQQNAASVTPPAGFTNYLGVTSLSAYSITSTDLFLLNQNIEGLNVADLGWGTANAQTITLSFWVRSSLTGTFGGSLRNSALNRSYPFSYTITAANTWEKETITITGDTSGTWLTTNEVGINLALGLGVGSTYSGTAGSWSGSNFLSSTGATSVVGTNGATFYITGVQLEKGSTATSFDYRPYGTELALCQRYYQKLGTASNAASGGEISICYGQNSGVRTNGNFGLVYSTMRAAPTITINALDVTDNVSYQTTVSGINAQRSGIDRAFLNLTFSSATGTAFDPMNLSTRNSTGFVDLNSEL
jgi:hypothetical protein